MREMKQLEAIKKLYENLNFEDPDIVRDIKEDYLTAHTTRSGKEVLWYLDESNNSVAINIDTLELLTDDEIEQEIA